jgi:hypothetical protein
MGGSARRLLGSGPQQRMHLGVGHNVGLAALWQPPRTRFLHLYGPQHGWRDRTANSCALAAYRTPGSTRPARHRFRLCVHKRRRPIGSALRSTRTLPTVRVPARTDNIAWPPVPARRVAPGLRDARARSLGATGRDARGPRDLGCKPPGRSARRTSGQFANMNLRYRASRAGECREIYFATGGLPLWGHPRNRATRPAAP